MPWMFTGGTSLFCNMLVLIGVLIGFVEVVAASFGRIFRKHQFVIKKSMAMLPALGIICMMSDHLYIRAVQEAFGIDQASAYPFTYIPENLNLDYQEYQGGIIINNTAYPTIEDINHRILGFRINLLVFILGALSSFFMYILLRKQERITGIESPHKSSAISLTGFMMLLVYLLF